MDIRNRKGDFRAVRGIARKVLAYGDNAAIDLGEQREGVARIDRAHDVADNVIDARLAEEAEVAAFRRQMPVELE